MKNVSAFLLAVLALAVTCAPLEAQIFKKKGQSAPPLVEPKLAPGQFEWQPERAPAGPILVVVSIDDQVAYVYRNSVQIARSTVSTGAPGHETPTGVFTILEKNRVHESNIYKGAQMPNMQRLTWSGIAMHAGQLPGYPASHGCIRLPYAFSDKLFGITEKGGTVVITRKYAKPSTSQKPASILLSSKVDPGSR
ncbi:MAG: L,D-transpeptidase family protein, partial [Verrucomicrobiales bacterium]|nr:L,D-transpeptidase family protein [Verrucomicrobiales bacterium]